jgi:hypothetical protein
VLLVDGNGQQVSDPLSGVVRNGVAQLSFSNLPSPGLVTAQFDGDPLSSFLVNFRPSDTALDLNFGNWSADVAAAQDGGRLALTFGADRLVSAMRGDAGSGLINFSLVRVASPSSTQEAVLLRNAAGAAADALTMARIFRAGESGWLGTEGQAMGGSGLVSTSIAAGSWRPVATRNGVELNLQELKVVGNGIQADFDGGVRALLTLSGSGSADSITGLSLTVRRLAANQNGLAFYEADPVTGALINGAGQGLLPDQAGYSAAALLQAEQSGLLLKASDLPDFGKQKAFSSLPLHADRNYGVLILVNDSRENLLSSFAQANPGGQSQFVAFAAEARGISYGIEDIAVSSGLSDCDFNDLVITLASNTAILHT